MEALDGLQQSGPYLAAIEQSCDDGIRYIVPSSVSNQKRKTSR